MAPSMVPLAARGAPRVRDVDPVDVVGGKQRRKALVGGVGLGRDDDAGGVLVDAVHDPRTRHAADAREARARVVQQGVDQGAVLAARRRMDGHAGRLVDHDQIGVLEQHGERDRLGRGLRGHRRRDLQAVVAGNGLGGSIRHQSAVTADPALGD